MTILSLAGYVFAALIGTSVLVALILAAESVAHAVWRMWFGEQS